MAQRPPCSFKKGMKMTQGKDWWSPKEKLWWERAQHKCEALGKRHPINSVGVQAEGTRTHSRRKRTNRPGSAPHCIETLHKLCVLTHEATWAMAGKQELGLVHPAVIRNPGIKCRGCCYSYSRANLSVQIQNTEEDQHEIAFRKTYN